MYLGIFVNTSLLLLIASTKTVHEHAPYRLTSKCTKRFSAKDKSVVTLWTFWKPAVRGRINLLHRFGETSSHPSSQEQKLQWPISQHWVKTMILAFKPYKRCDAWNWPCDKIRHNAFAFHVEFHQCWYPKKQSRHTNMVSILLHLSAFIRTCFLACISLCKVPEEWSVTFSHEGYIN